MDSPTKQVRFELHDTTYNYDPEQSSSSSEGDTQDETQNEGTHSPPTWVLSTPSPTRSVSTVSTDGPMTPPSVGSSTMTFTSFSNHEAKVPSSRRSPPDNNGSPRPHAFLINPSAYWDVVDRPTSDVISDLKLYGYESSVVDNAHRFPYLTLVHPRLRSWPLRIDLRRQYMFTVEEMFALIYQHLNEPLQDSEMARSNQGDAIWSAYAQRCKERRINPQQEPIRRIDCVRGARIFSGLREVDEDPGVWEIVLLSEAVS